MEYKVKTTNKFSLGDFSDDVTDPSELVNRLFEAKKKLAEEAKKEKLVVVEPVAPKTNERRGPPRDGDRRGNNNRTPRGPNNKEFRGDRGDRQDRRPREDRDKKRVAGATEAFGDLTVEADNEGGFEVKEARTKSHRNNQFRDKRGDRKDGEERKPRASGSNKTGVRSIPKRDGAGRGNWGTAKDELKGETEPISATEGDAEKPAQAADTIADDVSDESVSIKIQDNTLTLAEFKAKHADSKKDETPFNVRVVGDERYKKMNLVPVEKKKKEITVEEFEVIHREPRKQFINLDLQFKDSNKKGGRDNFQRRGNQQGHRSGKQAGFVLRNNAFPALGSV